MGTSDRFRQLIEKRLLDLGKFCGVHDFKYIFDFIQKHDLFRAIYFWPVAEKPKDNLEKTNESTLLKQETGIKGRTSKLKNYLFSERRVLFKELNNAIGQLGVIHAQTLYFMEGNQNTRQEELVLLLKREGEAINNRSKNLEQLCYSIEAFGLVHELEENVVDRPSNVRT